MAKRGISNFYFIVFLLYYILSKSLLGFTTYLPNEIALGEYFIDRLEELKQYTEQN